MKKFFRWIVDHPKIVMTITLILVVLSLVCIPFVQVNYDMSKYLPEDSFALKGKDILSENLVLKVWFPWLVETISLSGASSLKRLKPWRCGFVAILAGKQRGYRKPLLA